MSAASARTCYLASVECLLPTTKWCQSSLRALLLLLHALLAFDAPGVAALDLGKLLLGVFGEIISLWAMPLAPEPRIRKFHLPSLRKTESLVKPGLLRLHPLLLFVWIS